MIRPCILALVLALALTAPGFAADLYLKPSDTVPEKLLPMPPNDGTDVAKDEIAELHRIQKARTPDELARALYDDEHEDGWYLATVLGPNFNAKTLPVTAALLEQVRLEASAAAKPAKTYFHRLRPWAVDPTIVGCPHPGESQQPTSYPSGHATLGYSAAVVMANVLPDHAVDIMNRASQYGEERLVCGHHFRKDIEAGQTLGTVVGVLLIHDERFAAEMAKAKAELTAAGF
jgi:acid phosphatase (class A)